MYKTFFFEFALFDTHIVEKPVQNKKIKTAEPHLLSSTINVD